MFLGIVVIVITSILVVNYFKKDKGEITNISEESVVSEEPAAGSNYIVKEGDSLWKIAEKVYGTGFDWKKISEANKITNPSLIEKGQELKIR